MHYKAQDKKFQSWSGNRQVLRSRFPFILSSGPLRHLATTALLTVSGLHPHSVWGICLDIAVLPLHSLLKHRGECVNGSKGSYFALLLIAFHVIVSFKLNSGSALTVVWAHYRLLWR